MIRVGDTIELSPEEARRLCAGLTSNNSAKLDLDGTQIEFVIRYSSVRPEPAEHTPVCER